MKKLRYFLAATLMGATLLSSCDDSIYDINVSPNDPAVVVPMLVLPAAQAENAYVLGGYYLNLGSFWIQHYAQAPSASQWATLETYNLNTEDFDDQFSTIYNGSLMDYEYVRKKTAVDKNWKLYSIATLMQAYTYQLMADLYDKIPFTEALKGKAILQPHYDMGSVVYDSLLVRIDDAMSKDFDGNAVEDPDKYDMIFKGDMDKWQQFANTLKLKIYLRYVNVDSLASNGNRYYAQINALLSENNFLSEDAFFAGFKEQETAYNPFFNTFVDKLAGNVVLNSTLGTFLSSNSDPRLYTLFDPSASTTWASMATGTSLTVTGKTSIDYATPAITETYPVYFFTKEESYFLQAEAQERYGSTVTAAARFKAGVESALVSNGFKKDTVTYAYNGIQSIMEQKWVAAVNKTSIEAFFDYNRTGYPNFLMQSTTSVLPAGQRPKRLLFPQTERRTNANTPASVPLTTKVWWGK